MLPLAAVACLIASWGRDLPTAVMLLLGVVLAVAILSAVHHAEVVALRVGEPFGSLILAVAVTVIEVGMIIALVLSNPSGTTTLARDTVFAAVMITCNGIVGAALLVRTLRGGVARFNAAGAGSGLAAIGVLATLSLVLPTVTTSAEGPSFTTAQLAFAASAALVVYLIFVFVQAVRHRDYFLPPDGAETQRRRRHASAPSRRETAWSTALLVVSLVSVVGLAKVTSPLIEDAVAELGLPVAAVAVSIAVLVLLPESLAAIKAARRDRFQTSLNLAYGSAMASIGMTIPAIAVASWILGFDLVLGLSPGDITLLAITLITGILTVTPGRATLLQGGIHLSLFAAFLVLVVSP